MSEWISVKERTPNGGCADVFVRIGQGRPFCAYYAPHLRHWFPADELLDGQIDAITHWMPIPPLPQLDPVREALRDAKDHILAYMAGDKIHL